MKFCPRCGVNLDEPGNSKEKYRPDGAKSGRECVPCRRRRDREYHKKNYKYKGRGPYNKHGESS